MSIEDLFFYAFLIIALLISAASIPFLLSKVRKQQRILSQLSEAVGAMRSGNVMTATHDGTPYRFRYFAGSKNSPSYFLINIDCPSSGEFEIAEESSMDRFFKKIGISSEIQTGDPEFDGDFYILADSFEFAYPIFSLPEKRQAVREVFDLGFNSIKHDGKTIEARWSPFQLDEDFDPSIITETVSQLVILSKNMPALPQSMMFLGRPKWKAKKAAAFALPIIFIVAGIASLVIGLAWFEPLDATKIFLDSLRYSLPLLVFSLWLAVQLIRGRSGSHHELIWIVILSLVAFPLAGFGLETLFNGWLDFSPAATHSVRVTDKYTTRSKNSTNYYLLLDSWRKRGEAEKLKISVSLYRQIVPKRTIMKVVTKPGRYGFEWLVTYSVATPGTAAKGSVEGVYAYLKRGFDFYKQTNFQDAIVEYNKAIKLDPGNGEAYYFRGIAYAKSGVEDKALADFKKSIELDPIRIEAYQYLDWILARRSEGDEIIAYWTKLIELQPNNGKAYLERGGSSFRKGDLKSALSDADKSCSLGYEEGCRIYERFKGRAR